MDHRKSSAMTSFPPPPFMARVTRRRDVAGIRRGKADDRDAGTGWCPSRPCLGARDAGASGS